MLAEDIRLTINSTLEIPNYPIIVLEYYINIFIPVSWFNMFSKMTNNAYIRFYLSNSFLIEKLSGREVVFFLSYISNSLAML